MSEQTDLLREKVLELVQVLKSAPPFTASTSARALCHHLVTSGKLSGLRDLTESYDPSKPDVYEDIRNNHKEARENGDKLGASSLAIAMSSLPADEFGFVKSANRDKAMPLVQPSLLNLVPFLIEAHIDSALNNAAISQLRTLAKNEEFKRLYREILITDAVQFSISEDSSQSFGGGNYRSNLIFVYEFFRKGSTPYLIGSLPNTGTENSFADVVKAWLEQIRAPSENATFTSVFNRILAAQMGIESPGVEVQDWSKFTKDLLQIVLPVDLVYLPHLNMTNGLPLIVENVLASVAPEAMENEPLKTKILTSIPQNTLGFAEELWTDWTKQIDILSQAAQRSINQDTMGEIYEAEVDVGNVDYSRSEKHKVRDHQFGEGLAAAQLELRDIDVWNLERSFLSAPRFLPAEETKPYSVGTRVKGRRWWKEDLEPRQSSCFVAGTMVITSQGPLAIEALRESDRVLTRADTSEWGIVSDEFVCTPVRGGQITLCAINDEPAFFTPGHPFVDKFGRARAIDPVAAHQENPWLEVGALQIGHVLLHTADGCTYTEVPIRAINYETVSCNHVYGVHLREGLRSYHANGYLVRMNYPEITIKTIADALRQIPAAEQLRMLAHLEELQPLLSRFGQGTIMSLLKAELGRSDSELAALRTKPSSGPKVPALYFQRRSFDLTASMANLEVLGDHSILPQIDCLDGQVWLDGSACACAHVLERGFVWSRPLDNDLWEHGLCSFGGDYQMVAGDGFIWVDDDPSPSKPSAKAVQFQALAVALRAPTPKKVDENEELVWEPVLHSVSLLESNFEMRTAANYEHEILADLQEEGGGSSEDEESSDLIIPTDFGQANNVISDTSIIAETMKKVEKIEGLIPTAAASKEVEIIETYDLSCEVDTLNGGPTGEPSFKVLQVQKLRKHVNGGVPKFDFALPVLDQLAIKLNETASPGTQIMTMYETFVTTRENNELCCEIIIVSPERLALAADDNIKEESGDHGAKSYKGLKYTAMGLNDNDLDMRFIPQKIVLTTNTLKGLISGSWIEFDPEATGDEGESHRVSGTRIQAIDPVLISPLEPGKPAGPTPGSQPGFLPVQGKTRSVRDLMTGFAINTVELKRDTQELLKKVMHYHMDKDDRMLILGVEKRPVATGSPTYGIDEIPEDLADMLDPSLQEWIKSTYAPAWIAQCAAGLTDEQMAKFNIRVDVQWQRRLKYFWHGTGKHCLSRSREYNELNTQLSMLAFRRKYPRIGDYLSDKTMATDETSNPDIKQMSGGKKWAHLLFEQLMTRDMVGQIARESALAEIVQLNTLEMYCTMLNALWRDDKGTKDLGPLTLQLTNAVKARLLQDNLYKHRATTDPNQLANGLRDYLLDFFTLLFDDEASRKAGFSNDFRGAMLESLKTFNEWDEKYQKRSARKKAEETVDRASGMIKSAAALASGTIDGIKTVLSGRKGLAQVWAAAKRAARGQKGDYSSLSPTDFEPKQWTGVFTFVFGLGMTAWYVYESWDAWGQWIRDPKSLTATQKARLVLGSVQAFGNLVFTTYKAIELFRGKDLQTTKSLAESAAVNARQLELSVMNMSMATHPDVILESTDLAQRTRRNAVTSKEMALGTKKSKNVMAALAGEGHPEKVLDRVESLSKSEKMLEKGWAQGLKSRLKFNTTETWLRGFSCAMSLTMLVVACIAAGQAWEDLSLAERFQTVLTLVIQFCNLIVEVVVLVCTIPMWVGLAIAAIGFALQMLINWIVGSPKPPPTRLQKWWSDNNPGKDQGFFKRLPGKPQTLLDYSINTTKFAVGSDSTLVITGTASSREVDSQFNRLKSINIHFAASTVSGAGVLFNAKAQSRSDLLKQSVEPGPGECSVYLPTSLSKVHKTDPDDIGRPVFSAQIGEVGTSLTTFRYDLGVEVNNEARAPDSPLLSIKLAQGEQIVFKMRGPIAAQGKPDMNDKSDYSKSTPPWNKYTIRVVETYADVNDEMQGTADREFEIEKVI